MAEKPIGLYGGYYRGRSSQASRLAGRPIYRRQLRYAWAPRYVPGLGAPIEQEPQSELLPAAGDASEREMAEAHGLDVAPGPEGPGPNPERGELSLGEIARATFGGWLGGKEKGYYAGLGMQRASESYPSLATPIATVGVPTLVASPVVSMSRNIAEAQKAKRTGYLGQWAEGVPGPTTGPETLGGRRPGGYGMEHQWQYESPEALAIAAERARRDMPTARLGYDPAEPWGMRVGTRMATEHEMVGAPAMEMAEDPAARTGMAIGRGMGSMHEARTGEVAAGLGAMAPSGYGSEHEAGYGTGHAFGGFEGGLGGGERGEGGAGGERGGYGFGVAGEGFGDNEGYGGGEGGARGTDSDTGCIAIKYIYGPNSKQWRYAQVFCARYMSYRMLDGYYKVGEKFISLWNRWPRTISWGERFIVRPFYHYMLYKLNRRKACVPLRLYGWCWMKIFKQTGRKNVRAWDLPYIGCKIGE